jgi:hypothetical protein
MDANLEAARCISSRKETDVVLPSKTGHSA